jgi:hypothetical protein
MLTFADPQSNFGFLNWPSAVKTLRTYVAEGAGISDLKMEDIVTVEKKNLNIYSLS